MASPRTYTARLEEKLSHNSRYTQLSFELIKPHRLEFQAGQYVSLKINDQGERRSYSICSTPDIKHQFELVVDFAPGGLGAQFLQNLKTGALVEILAPLGQLVVPERLSAQHLVFVATGSGIAPLRAMIIDQLRNKQDQRQITLHWGMRHPEDLFWLDDWQELAAAFPNFHFHPVLSQAPAAWTLCKGRVTDCLSIHTLPSDAAYFLCGSQTMISDVEVVLSGKMINQKLVFKEKFY